MRATLVPACIGVLAGALACTGPRPMPTRAPVNVPAPSTNAASGVPPPEHAARPEPTARVRVGAVDDIVAGSPIPARYLTDDARYEARWVADAQPLEGFLIGSPPVWVTLRDGPMAQVEPGPLEQLKPELAPKALAAARAGAVVGGIVIEEPGITTEAGIGVGSSYESLTEAYAGLELQRLPEWFEAKITCIVHTKALPGVRFLLESCKKGGPFGAVKRILVHEP